MPNNPPTDPRAPWSARLFAALQAVLPQHALSGVVYRLTRLQAGALTTAAIRGFARAFRVDLAEAVAPDPAAYPSFNAFFTRALRDDARPLAESGTLACPVDGHVSQAGTIAGGTLLQAKGHVYSVADLLGGNTELASAFQDGQYATLYLSPRDYHRIHMPLDGTLRRMLHVPGRLFSVNAATTGVVPRLFARNERLVCLFDTALGPLAVVLVGAIFVGSMETVWAGQVTPPRGRGLAVTDYAPGAVALARGAELGRFNMGSTVILLLPKGAVTWPPTLLPGAPVHCRAALGRVG